MHEEDLRLFELIEVGVWIFDVDGMIAWLSSAAERMLGRPRSDVTGHHFSEFLAEDRREVTRTQFDRKVQLGVGVTEFESAVVDAKGRRVPFKAIGFPLCRDGDVVGVLGFGYSVPSQSAPRGLPDHWPVLTPRRHQILKLLADGMSTAEISVELVLSEQTVRNHVRDVLRELGAHSRLEAVNMAWRLGLLGPDAAQPGRES